MIDAYFFKIFIKAKRPILPLKKVVILRSGRHRTLDIGRWRSDRFQVSNFPPLFPSISMWENGGGENSSRNPVTV